MTEQDLTAIAGFEKDISDLTTKMAYANELNSPRLAADYLNTIRTLQDTVTWIKAGRPNQKDGGPFDLPVS